MVFETTQFHGDADQRWANPRRKSTRKPLLLQLSPKLRIRLAAAILAIATTVFTGQFLLSQQVDAGLNGDKFDPPDQRTADSPSIARPPQPPLTGKRLTQFLHRPISIEWTQAPFAERLVALAEQRRIAVFIDRRLDPDVKVDLALVNVTFEQLLWALADELNVGVCRIGSVYYFGPLETAQVLPVLWHQLPGSSRVRVPNLQWDQLTSPAVLLGEISQQHGLRIINPQSVHHDLWRANFLPALSPIEKVAIIAVGFERWPARVNGSSQTLELKPFPTLAEGAVTFEYRALAGQKASTLKRELQKEFRKVRFVVKRDQVSARGSVAMLHQVKAFLVDQHRLPVPSVDSIRFTLKTSASRGQILRAVATQLKRDLRTAGVAESLLEEQIDVQCQQATLAQLLRLILQGTPLTPQVSDQAIVITTE